MNLIFSSILLITAQLVTVQILDMLFLWYIGAGYEYKTNAELQIGDDIMRIARNSIAPGDGKGGAEGVRQLSTSTLGLVRMTDVSDDTPFWSLYICMSCVM